jgi:hypothetical protein
MSLQRTDQTNQTNPTERECTIILPKDKTLLFNSILATLIKNQKVKIIGEFGKLEIKDILDILLIKELNPDLLLTIQTRGLFFNKFPPKNKISVGKGKLYFGKESLQILKDTNPKIEYFPKLSTDDILDMYIHDPDNKESYNDIVLIEERDPRYKLRKIFDIINNIKEYKLSSEIDLCIVFNETALKQNFIYSNAFRWFLEKAKRKNINIRIIVSKKHNIKIDSTSIEAMGLFLTFPNLKII